MLTISKKREFFIIFLFKFHILRLYLNKLNNITYNSNAIEGKYKSVDVRIGGATHDVSSSYLIPQEMNDLLTWYTSEPITINRIIEFTCKFINIHSLMGMVELQGY